MSSGVQLRALPSDAVKRDHSQVGADSCGWGADDGEEGRITILIVAAALLVVVLVLVSTAATSVHLQRRQLLACADAVALATVGQLRVDPYYGDAEISYPDELLEVRAGETFGQYAASVCQVGRGAQLVGASVSAQRVRVEVEAWMELPLIPTVLELQLQPLRVRVASVVELR